LWLLRLLLDNDLLWLLLNNDVLLRRHTSLRHLLNDINWSLLNDRGRCCHVWLSVLDRDLHCHRGIRL